MTRRVLREPVRMPWANGRGETSELFRRDDADGILLRLSVADVVEPGPFSPLPGIDRTILLIEGAGFDLSVDGRVETLRPFEPVRFSGDAQAAAVAVAGPSRDLNLMSARGRVAAALDVRRGAVTLAPAPLRLAFVAAGRFAAGGEALAPGDVLLVEDDAPLALAGDGTLVLVEARRIG